MMTTSLTLETLTRSVAGGSSVTVRTVTAKQWCFEGLHSGQGLYLGGSEVEPSDFGTDSRDHDSWLMIERENLNQCGIETLSPGLEGDLLISSSFVIRRLAVRFRLAPVSSGVVSFPPSSGIT
jgi:hypothetical protein